MIKCLGTRPINAPSVLTTGIVEKFVLLSVLNVKEVGAIHLRRINLLASL